MEAAGATASAPKGSAGHRLADLFHGRPRLQVGALLSAPLAWLVILYLGSLAVLLISAFWSVDALSGELNKTLTTTNFHTIFTDNVYGVVAWRTIRVAGLVTLTDAVLAFPIAFYMAKVAGRKTKAVLLVAVLMPLWSFYLVKVYGWNTILQQGGVWEWAFGPIGLKPPASPITDVWLVESYLWLPFMILPIYAGLARIPDSMLNASEDLGARPLTTFRRVILPLAFPALVAGSIFTISLTLGDYITPSNIARGTQFIGTIIFGNITTNLPLASAYAVVPIVVMIVYLAGARKLGAFEHL